jgi:hypothetical protein
LPVEVAIAAAGTHFFGDRGDAAQVDAIRSGVAVTSGISRCGIDSGRNNGNKSGLGKKFSCRIRSIDFLWQARFHEKESRWAI